MTDDDFLRHAMKLAQKREEQISRLTDSMDRQEKVCSNLIAALNIEMEMCRDTRQNYQKLIESALKSRDEAMQQNAALTDILRNFFEGRKTDINIGKVLG